MIKVNRGLEPNELKIIRDEELVKIRSLGRAPSSKEISNRYRDMAPILWELQHYKCCYCEHRISMSYNDVEHFRPKSAATRLPGCDLRHGYWWLAYSWSNLLYSCSPCNRSYKKEKFPLAPRSISLIAEVDPPGDETPLLLDPAGSVHPMEHIEFKLSQKFQGGRTYWMASPRNNSELGAYTIDVCSLNRDELLELRSVYYRKIIEPQILALQREIGRLSILEVDYQYLRALEMIKSDMEFAALTYYAFKTSIPGNSLQSIIGKSWPDPSVIHPL